MASNTTNYNLVKPAGNEFYNVEVSNGNMDIIDTELKIVNDAVLDHVEGINPHPQYLMSDNLTTVINEHQGDDIASAAITDIGNANGNFIRIIGTTTITALGTAQAGSVRKVRFAGSLTLTHNGASLILPGGVNLPVAAGDVCEFISLGGGNWVLTNYQPAANYNMHAKKITNLASGEASGEAIHYGQFLGNFNTNGYRRLPDSTMLQWGRVGEIPADGAVWVGFPQSFTISCYAVVVTSLSRLFGALNSETVGAADISAAGYTAWTNADHATWVSWIAIGR